MEQRFSLQGAVWHDAAEKPQDRELCVAIFQTEGKYGWMYGTYFAEKEEFFCDNGMGGEMLRLDFCRAWCAADELQVTEQAAPAAEAVTEPDGSVAAPRAAEAPAKGITAGSQLYLSLVLEFELHPRDIHTVPKTRVKPKWFHVFAREGRLWVEEAHEQAPSISAKNGAFALKKNEAEAMLKLHHRREAGESVTEQAARVSFAQAYWYGVFAELGL